MVNPKNGVCIGFAFAAMPELHNKSYIRFLLVDFSILFFLESYPCFVSKKNKTCCNLFAFRGLFGNKTNPICNEICMKLLLSNIISFSSLLGDFPIRIHKFSGSVSVFRSYGISLHVLR